VQATEKYRCRVLEPDRHTRVRPNPAVEVDEPIAFHIVGERMYEDSAVEAALGAYRTWRTDERLRRKK
jgi:hypothetical protein